MPPRATRPAAPAARCTAPAAHCAAPRRAPPPPPPPPRRRPAYALFPAPPRPLPAAVRAVASAYAEEPLADAEKPPLVTLAEVYDVARSRGVALAFSTLGPAYRVVARDGSAEGEILGVTSGFIIPFAGLMHCDTLRVFTRGRGGAEGERLRGGASGLGLLLGGATFAYGLAAGCRTAEILAINDDENTHARLVRYYSHFGFRPVRVVGGGGLADLPHLLVWGGAGTRMDADLAATLHRWSRAIRGARRRPAAGGSDEPGA